MAEFAHVQLLSSAEKTALIQKIMHDSTKTPQERQQLIREILSGSVGAPVPPPIDPNDCTYRCTHYKKKCSRFFFSCCNRRDNCHRCHKELRSCTAPKVAEIICDDCNTAQEPAKSCINCSIVFSNSFCSICNIWTERDIFHCNDCGLCRVGSQAEHFHCQTCNGCFLSSSRDSHVCIFRPMNELSCPICMDPIHSSQSAGVILPCRHVVHQPCRTASLQKGIYRCPSCRHSMIEMSPTWESLRESIRAQPMPLEHQVEVQYTCFDCSHRGPAMFHFLGIECGNCGSFNTSR
jgi:hypothetical protein